MSQTLSDVFRYFWDFQAKTLEKRTFESNDLFASDSEPRYLSLNYFERFFDQDNVFKECTVQEADGGAIPLCTTTILPSEVSPRYSAVGGWWGMGWSLRISNLNASSGVWNYAKDLEFFSLALRALNEFENYFVTALIGFCRFAQCGAIFRLVRGFLLTRTSLSRVSQILSLVVPPVRFYFALTNALIVVSTAQSPLPPPCSCFMLAST